MRRVICGLVLIVVGAGLAYDLSLAAGWWKTRQTHARSGFTAREFVDADGEKYGYVLFVPHQRPIGEKPALLLFLNGTGENGEDGVQQISNNFGAAVWEMRRNCPIVCLAPQCRRDWSSGFPDMLRAIAILDLVIEEYDVDRDRLYVTGVSSGGAGTWEIAAAYPGKFAAIVPLSGTCRLSHETIVDAFADQDLAIWNFYNDGDLATGLVENNRTFRERLFAAGLSPIFTEYHQSHHDAWNAGYRSAAMYEWLIHQTKTANAQWAAGARFRRLLAEENDWTEWERQGPDEWRLTDGILSCGNEAFGEASHLKLAKELTDFELHFDYRTPSDAPCELVLDSSDAPGESVRIVIEWPERGTSSVVQESSGECLGAAEPLGQRALVSGRWNDIRLTLRERRLQLHVNGAELYDVRDERLAGKHRVGLRIPAGEASDREWRYLRLRELTSSQTASRGRSPEK